MNNILYEILSINEASTIWNLDKSTVKKYLQKSNCPLIKNVDYKKSGKTWLITKNAMIKLYGLPN